MQHDELTIIDLDFAHAVRLASDALFSRGRRGSTAALIEYLLSDRQIGRGERQYLADLIEGDFRRARGKPPLNAAERSRRRDAVARLAAVKAQWRGEGRRQPFHADALQTVAAEFGVDVETLDEWHRSKKHG
jgi:hypothetical protein